MDNKIITYTLTPEEAISLGIERPIAEQEYLKSIGQAYMQYADIKTFGIRRYILTLLQIIYNAGRIEGIRAERKKKEKHNIKDGG